MASEQSMAQVIIQAVIEATKAEIMIVREIVIPINTTRPALAVPKTGGSVLK